MDRLRPNSGARRRDEDAPPHAPPRFNCRPSFKARAPRRRHGAAHGVRLPQIARKRWNKDRRICCAAAKIRY